ncbi:WYL domain-containing protein [Lutibacter sp.]|uniref:helix-turn-helix transcriptional regulator n=1 Tax=Lutibacter sp. TaxID=1925666 RepID=UPI001A34FC6D|nr:WYL domain-containing protein [Lutibacter sp.]MBI9041953.1 WYL domain-containing protein [Lutibacter sp.]
MATHIISRRIQCIIQYIYDFHYPSKVDLLNFLKDKDFIVSPRTLERDIERIRTDFGLEIVYSKAHQGYFIDKSKSVKVESFFKFLEIVTVADILSESLKDSNKMLEYVSFDDSKNLKGIDNLKEILVAINQKRKLHFVHENFWRNTLKNYEITPLFLKEYENRWYVIGVPKELNEIRTFGIDRISELKLGTLSNVKRSHFKSQLKNFDDIIGLDFNQGKPTKIRLLVDGIHIKYMRSLPLHHSQNIHTENEKGEFFVDFFLIPNYEFITQILKIGSEVEVIYPTELRDEIKNILTKSLNKYK